MTVNQLPTGPREFDSHPAHQIGKVKEFWFASPRSATNLYSILGVKTNSRFHKIWFEPMFFYGSFCGFERCGSAAFPNFRGGTSSLRACRGAKCVRTNSRIPHQIGKVKEFWFASLRSATNLYSILGGKTNSRFHKIWFEPMFFYGSFYGFERCGSAAFPNFRGGISSPPQAAKNVRTIFNIVHQSLRSKLKIKNKILKTHEHKR